eukprot:3325106-Heterocapsa_arctica.AAC.1
MGVMGRGAGALGVHLERHQGGGLTAGHEGGGEKPSEGCDTGADPGGGRDAREVGLGQARIVGVEEEAW